MHFYVTFQVSLMNKQASLTLPKVAYILKWQKQSLGECWPVKVKLMLRQITKVSIQAKNEETLIDALATISQTSF